MRGTRDIKHSMLDIGSKLPSHPKIIIAVLIPLVITVPHAAIVKVVSFFVELFLGVYIGYKQTDISQFLAKFEILPPSEYLP